MLQEVLLATILQAAAMHPPDIQYRDAIGDRRISHRPGAGERKSYERTGLTKPDIDGLQCEVIMPQVCTYISGWVVQCPNMCASPTSIVASCERAKPTEERIAQLDEHLLYSKYLHDIFDARFDDAECRACSQVAQKSDWAEEIAESKAVLGEDTILLAIKVYPSSLQYQPAA